MVMRRAMKAWMAALCLALPLAAEPPQDFYQRGTISFDWFGSRAADGTFFNQVSTRIRFDLINRPGTGWTLELDGRDRAGFMGTTRNQAILYDARLTFDSAHSPFYLSVGQMNMYDSAGIGELLGGIVGFKITPAFLVGGYGGLESSPYISLLQTNYLKFGAFVRWLGGQGKSFTLSYNQLRYQGKTERQFGYANLFLPVPKILTLYADVEYELGPHTASANRLSRAFLNARVDLGRWADVTGFASTGKGLDYHQFLIEASQNPGLNGQNVARFFYTDYYGARLSLKPSTYVRLSVSREQSEQKDLNILNHTWRFDASAWNIFGQGLSATADYAINRGNAAESNSYCASLTKEFAHFSLTANYSNVYNGVRFDSSGGTPQIIHLSNSRNVGASTLIRVSRKFLVSLEYNYFLQLSANQHFFFVRLIYRTY